MDNKLKQELREYYYPIKTILDRLNKTIEEWDRSYLIGNNITNEFRRNLMHRDLETNGIPYNMKVEEILLKYYP